MARKFRSTIKPDITDSLFEWAGIERPPDDTLPPPYADLTPIRWASYKNLRYIVCQCSCGKQISLRDVSYGKDVKDCGHSAAWAGYDELRKYVDLDRHHLQLLSAAGIRDPESLRAYMLLTGRERRALLRSRIPSLKEQWYYDRKMAPLDLVKIDVDINQLIARKELKRYLKDAGLD